MVATSRQRKAGATTTAAAESPRTYNNQRLADGRRQLLGLSQAIREKAFQSTSPSSEAQHRESGVSPKNNQRHAAATTNKSYSPPTIEERLRSLLNSDTEETKDMKALKKATSMVNHHTRSKTTSSVLPEKPSKKQTSKRKSDEFVFNLGHNELLVGEKSVISAPSQLKVKPSSPCRKTNQSSPIRRCQSAVPPSFHDEDWNKVIASTPLSREENLKHANMNSRQNQAWMENRRGPISNKAPAVAVMRPNSTGFHFHRRPNSEYGRCAPPMRQSANCERENRSPIGRVPVEPNLKTSVGLSLATSQTPVGPYIQRNPISHSTPAVNTYSSQQCVNNVKVPHHALDHGLVHSSRLSVGPSGHQMDIRRCNTPSPSHRINETFCVSPDRAAITKAIHNQNALTFAPSSQPKLHPNMNRDYYPQQNFSFRRAVHRSISSESDFHRPNDLKCRPVNTPTSPPGGDKCSRKSDDRDSGTVVEPEASVFDFDSSVLTEEERDVNKFKQDTRSPPSRGRSPEKETAWSRSSTPLLPPLSFDEENEDTRISSVPKEIKNEVICTSSFTQNQSQNGSTRNVKPEYKVQPLLRSNETFRLASKAGMEHPTTQSRLNEMPTRKPEQRAKVLSSKLQRSASANRRSFRRRNSSGDERKPKLRNRRAFDDSDLTDCSSMQQAAYKLPKGRKYSRDPSYRASYHSVTNDRSEFGETSSVRSITTTSVCSSVLRKTGSRRHYRRNQFGGDTHARELRSVSKRFTKLESHVVTLARSLAQLSAELRQQNMTSRELDQLRHEMQELKARQMFSIEPKNRKSLSSSSSKGGSQPKVKKLVKFFGEQPPLLTIFLKQLGYEKYIKNFESESIGMMELPYMDEKRLQDIGIPLGPRLRIIKEAQKSSYV